MPLCAEVAVEPFQVAVAAHQGIVLMPQAGVNSNEHNNTAHQSQNGQQQKLNTDSHSLPPLFFFLTYTVPQFQKMKRGNR